MYLTLAGPHTEYASSVWDPHLQKDKTSLEDIQKFVMRVCAKQCMGLEVSGPIKVIDFTLDFVLCIKIHMSCVTFHPFLYQPHSFVG